MRSRKGRRFGAHPVHRERRAADPADPRRFFDRRGRADGKNRKAFMLARQAFEALCLSLGSVDEPALEAAQVLGVEPAGNMLVVTVSVPMRDPADLQDALVALHFAKGRLREEVAGAIYRKHAPDLAFNVVPRERFRPAPAPAPAEYEGEPGEAAPDDER
jgi:hypothetical protein